MLAFQRYDVVVLVMIVVMVTKILMMIVTTMRMKVVLMKFISCAVARVRSAGTAKVSINVMTKNMGKFGFSEEAVKHDPIVY